MADADKTQQRENLERKVNNANGEPNNSSRDKSHPDSDELYVDSAELADADKKSRAAYDKKLFPKDGRDTSGDVDDSPEEKRAESIEQKKTDLPKQ